MTNEDIKLALSIISGIAVIGGFIFWHFKTVNGFKDDIHKLDLKLKDLEQKDNLQQLTIDRLSELYPLLNTIFEKINTKSHGS